MPSSDIKVQVPSSAVGKTLLVLVRSLRPHQWLKNMLVFLPALAGHRFSIFVFAEAGLAFLSFCAASSSGYLVNDLLDASTDRLHRRKKRRPIASGELGAPLAAALASGLALAGLVCAWLVSPLLCLITAFYLASSFAYSAIFKRKVIADVMVLAALYTLRVVAGGAATGIPLSKWLIIFSLFLFVALAMAKRCSEVAATGEFSAAGLDRRGYRTADLPLLIALGAAAGYASVLAVALYIASPDVGLLYSHIDRLWFVVPLLIYWVSRVLLLASRGDLHEDPIIFAVTDPATWITGAGVAAIVAAAT